MESVREGYEKYGVDEYYKQHSNDYQNPHKDILKLLLSNNRCKNTLRGRVLDLCCGSGEVTKILQNCECVGCDPYTYDLYKKETGCSCFTYSFKDIARGSLQGENFSVVVCSFALHLCELSMLDTVLYQLSRVTDTLIIITPHKRPDIHNFWVLENEFIIERVRCRIYKRKEF